MVFSGFSGPRGLKIYIRAGSRVKLFNKATIIATPVNNPKYIVGIKLDRVKIENPTVIVIDV